MEKLVKVCGMCEAENIQEVASCGIDWMGFIFYDKSPRRFRGETIALPKTIQRVGVFVNASLDDIRSTARRFALDLLQLHGEESPEMCAFLRAEGYRVIKAISVANEADMEQTARYEAVADYFLFDTRCPGYGGSGLSFDWSILKTYYGSIPFFLSGGLKMDSLQTLQTLHHPQWIGIDLNSGFETRPGHKDALLLQHFINSLKN